MTWGMCAILYATSGTNMDSTLEHDMNEELKVQTLALGGLIAVLIAIVGAAVIITSLNNSYKLEALKTTVDATVQTLIITEG
jgi:hypothetical protein